MNHKIPRVSIGLPVYNGERLIKNSLDSILSQSYQDFELIITDNCSTDGTQEICLQYAAQDNRIRYYRNEKNLGVVKNFNKAFELSRGEYFKWAAHDDMIHPDFLAKCVLILDSDKSIVLCFSKIQIMNKNGIVKRNYSDNLNKIDSDKPYKRFGNLIINRHGCFHDFGLIRSSVLRKTELFASYISSDRVFTAELGLHGRFYEIPEDLFILGDYPDRAMKKYPFYLRAALWDPSTKDKIVFPNWRVLIEHFKSIFNVPLTIQQKIMCVSYLLLYVFAHFNFAKMLMDVIVVIIPGSWRLHMKIKAAYKRIKKNLKSIKNVRSYETSEINFWISKKTKV